MGGSAFGEDLREHQPLHGTGVGHGPGGGRRGRGQGGQGRPRGFRRGALGNDDGHRKGAFDAAARGTPGRKRAGVGGRREHGQRQAPQGDGRPARGAGGVVLLLRRG